MLVVGYRPQGQREFCLEAVYPLGKPNDEVDPAVPLDISADFREALRCQWIRAFKGTVTMCRRAVQGSVLVEGATGGRLIDQIDDLFKKGRITESLRDMAHEIRLTGNIGAHPDEDGLKDVSEQDADDMIEFTREYFHHVYVMPNKLETRRKKEKAWEIPRR